MNLEIKIVKNSDALELLKDEAFVMKWKGLTELNNKVTVMQEPPFVITWYLNYSNTFQPFFVLGYDKNSELVGLIPLAFSMKDKSIVHAGGMQAEYHGWLATKDLDQDFIVQAIISVKRDFKVRKWVWGWTPPGSNLDWVNHQTLKKEKIYIKFLEEDSPMLDLNDGEKIEKLKKNRSLRTKINRYKKRGDFYIKRIRTKQEAKNVFDLLEKQCDFRKMTLNHVPPFASDLNKKQFLIDKLNYPEDNHFTILWSKDEPIAFHIGECDHNTVYLALMSHDPLEGKNSPGRILLIKLAELLKEEGFSYFDLTPGGDEYKETYSNFSRKVFYHVIYFDKKDKIISDFKDQLRKIIKYSISSIGAQPTIIANKVSNITTFVKNIFFSTPSVMFRKFISSFYLKKTLIYFKLSTNIVSTNIFQSNESININKYSDLMLNIKNNQWSKRSPLISTAQTRFNSGDLLYTLVKNGVLAQYGWKSNKWQTFMRPEVYKDFEIDDKSAFLYDFFTDPVYMKEELCKETLQKMLIDCINNDEKDVIIACSESNIPFQNIIKELGFKILLIRKKRTIFGFTKESVRSYTK